VPKNGTPQETILDRNLFTFRFRACQRLTNQLLFTFISVFFSINVVSFKGGKGMAKVNIQPLFDNVLVKPLEAEQKLPSGIVLPDSAKEKPQTGQIMAVGAGTTDEKGNQVKMVVKVGDKVMYKKWGGNEVKVNGEEWMIVEQKDILAIVE
jgi:chaperonin GroES